MEDSDGRGPGPRGSTSTVDERSEARVALKLTLLVLVVLTVVKPLGGVPYLGPLLLTGAAAVQLIAPLRRLDALGLDLDYLGLHLHTWRRDGRIVLALCAIFFPPYVVGHHLFVTEAHSWAQQAGWATLARHIPQMHLAPQWPADLATWGASAWWLLGVAATHTLGVALPEETFYRGYLQPRLHSLWPPRRPWLGGALGRAEVVACALFAAGHFLGEWNPLRLGPFFPALLFAWQRNMTGSILGAITFHAACNILGEVLFTLYQPL